MAKILIVDDEEVAHLTLAEILRLEGYTIQAVNSGEAAIEALCSEDFDVMILDLKMGGISGIEVLNSLDNAHSSLAVIILTAYGSVDTAIQAIRHEVSDYILKPAAPEQVVESIGRALAKKRVSGKVMEDAQPGYNSRIEALPGGACLAWDKRQISWKLGTLSLTPTEARLLKILFEHKNEMVPHSELVFLIQGYRLEMEEAAKILRPVVSRLRQKLTSVPQWGDRIKNVRGAGYVLEIG